MHKKHKALNRIKYIFYRFSMPFRILYNKGLCKKYPFLKIKNWDGTVSTYKYTFLDDMPRSWRKDFGIKMCEEIRKELIRCSTPEINWLDHYSLSDVKEKYGTLRWYDNGEPINSRISDIISKYEDRSGMICFNCGNYAKYKFGYHYYCEHCFEKEGGIKTDKNEFSHKLTKLDIPYRTIWYQDGTTKKIESEYKEEMERIWGDD